MKTNHSRKRYDRSTSLEAKYQRKLWRCIAEVQSAMEMIENSVKFDPNDATMVGPHWLLPELRAALKKALDSIL